MKVLLGLGAIFLIGFTSCRTNCRSLQKKSPESAYISIERTACFGTCPVDHYTLYINGHQRYEGKMFSSKKGEHLADLSEKEACELFKHFENQPWEQWDTLYPTLYSDLPSYILRYQNVKVKKEIIVSGDCPEKLRELMDQLLRLSDCQEWRAAELK